ncbi:MAG TPA: hypothetical protein VJ976_08685 [Ornithinimicrobium sp.]|uniref:hypothetical protein n=1 Tax=Ornithinimicrobium sp. TaxID=1977084 RepID=UPI002B4A42EC|nr:hypothetical protein [Ornithinimicrobium sp.]HKJ12445.1 hypothetical protein [Ornithinimicrobium sp.]
MKFWPLLLLLIAMATMPPSATARKGSPEDLLVDNARAVSGGALVTQATSIEPGVTYSDAVADEQARWYAVYVGEGQQVEVEMAEPGTLDYGCCVELRLYAPDQERDYGREGGYSEGVPKIYRTQTGEDGAVASGTHYVSVELDDFGPLDRELPYQVKVNVGGGASPEQSDDSAAADPFAGDEQADGQTAANQGEAETGEDQGDASAAETSEEGSVDMLLTLLIVMGVLVMGLGAAVVYLLVRLGRQ